MGEEDAVLGAGEILLTSMDQDGQKRGFDLALTRAVTDALEIPVIASGGVGNLQHLADGVKQGRRGCSAGGKHLPFWRIHRATGQAVHGAAGYRGAFVSLRTLAALGGFASLYYVLCD